MTKRLHLYLLFSQFFMLLALEMGNPFLPLFIKNQTNLSAQNTALLNALALALPMLANILLGPFWGKMADRYGYKPMLLRAAWALTISQAAMALVSDVSMILFIRVLQGGFAGFIAAMQSYTLSICSWQEKSQHLGRLQSAKAIASSCAGAMGGVLLGYLHFHGLFFLTCLICLCTTLCMHFYLPKNTTRKRIASKKKPSARSYSYSMMILLALITLSQIAKFLPEVELSLYVTNTLHQPLWMLGLFYSLPALGALLGTSWCTRRFDRCRDDNTRIASYFYYFLILLIVLMLGHAFIQQPLILLGIRLGWGVVFAALLPALFTLISDCSSEQGYAMGLANAFAKLGNLIGILLGGWLSIFMPFHHIFLVITGIYFCMFILVFVTQSFSQTTSFLPHFSAQS
jgi:MFS family permease